MKNSSTPPLPERIPYTLFVVELDKYVVITSCQITKCEFTCYRFDGNKQLAYRAADEIARESNKLVANMVEFPPDNPFVYDPNKYEEIERALIAADDADDLADNYAG
jgi:hypothetical protein